MRLDQFEENQKNTEKYFCRTRWTLCLVSSCVTSLMTGHVSVLRMGRLSEGVLCQVEDVPCRLEMTVSDLLIMMEADSLISSHASPGESLIQNIDPLTQSKSSPSQYQVNSKLIPSQAKCLD